MTTGFGVYRCPRCTKPHLRWVRQKDSSEECTTYDAWYVYCKHCTWEGHRDKVVYQKNLKQGQWLKIREEMKRFDEKQRKKKNVN